MEKVKDLLEKNLSEKEFRKSPEYFIPEQKDF